MVLKDMKMPLSFRCIIGLGDVWNQEMVELCQSSRVRERETPIFKIW